MSERLQASIHALHAHNAGTNMHALSDANRCQNEDGKLRATNVRALLFVLTQIQPPARSTPAISNTYPLSHTLTNPHPHSLTVTLTFHTAQKQKKMMQIVLTHAFAFAFLATAPSFACETRKWSASCPTTCMQKKHIQNGNSRDRVCVVVLSSAQGARVAAC